MNCLLVLTHIKSVFHFIPPENIKNRRFLRLLETQNALQLPVFFLSFFCQPYKGLRNYKSVFLILKISQYGGSRWWVLLLPRYPCKLYKNWYLHFYKSYDHHIWQAGTSARFDSGETTQVGAGDVRMETYLDGLLPIKSHDPLITWSCKITWQIKFFIFLLPKCLWPRNLAKW